MLPASEATKSERVVLDRRNALGLQCCLPLAVTRAIAPLKQVRFRRNADGFSVVAQSDGSQPHVG